MRDVFDDMFDALVGRSFKCFPTDDGVTVEKKYCVPSFPPVEVKANDNGMSFKFVLAGYKKEDLKIDFERSSLILSTSETFKEPEEDKDVVVSTIKTPMFRYAYSIPITKLDTEKTSAKFEDGILTITIPPLEEGKKKKSVIEIR